MGTLPKEFSVCEPVLVSEPRPVTFIDVITGKAPFSERVTLAPAFTAMPLVLPKLPAPMPAREGSAADGGRTGVGTGAAEVEHARAALGQTDRCAVIDDRRIDRGRGETCLDDHNVGQSVGARRTGGRQRPAADNDVARHLGSDEMPPVATVNWPPRVRVPPAG